MIFQSTRKQVQQLAEQFEKAHGLLFGEIARYIKRLENISQTNMTYLESYTMWRSRFTDVRDVSDPQVQTLIINLQDLLSNKQKGEIKKMLPEAKEHVLHYTESVNDLFNGLKNKFKVEEEARMILSEQQEKFRSIKARYFLKQADLSLLSSSLEVVFKKLDSLFDEVSGYLEDAHYIDAQNLLTKEIAPVLKAIDQIFEELPRICLEISTILPTKVGDLTNHYQEMIKEGFPLFNVLNQGNLDEYIESLNDFEARAKGLNFTSLKNDIAKMEESIEDKEQKLKKERESRSLFEQDITKTYEFENKLESNFINLNHSLPTVRTIYLLDNDDSLKIDNIQNIINKAGATKRQLDTFIHSGTKQPYSYLLEKMNLLKGQEEEGQKAIDEFVSYLGSLKKTTEASNELVKDYYIKVKKAEVDIREIDNEVITKKTEETLKKLFQNIDDLHEAVTNRPIDVKKCEALSQSLRDTADKFVEEIKVDKEYERKAREAVLLANRFRSENPEIDVPLIQAESFYQNGQFLEAYNLAMQAAKPFVERDE